MELLRHVTLGQFVPGHSIVHRLDARVKLGLLVIGMATIFSCQHIVPLCIFGGICVGAVACARIRVRYFLAGLRTISLLIAVTFLFNLAFIRGGTPLLSIGGWSVDREGLHVAGLLTARVILLFLTTSLFTLTTSPIRLTDALESLTSGLRLVGVRTAELSMTVSIALRFIPTLVDTTEKIMKAQLSRGARFDEGSVLSRAQAMVSVLVPLFVQALHAADVLAEAMEARCYRGGMGRTRLVTLSAEGKDIVAVLLCGVAAIGLLVLDLWLGRHGR